MTLSPKILTELSCLATNINIILVFQNSKSAIFHYFWQFLDAILYLDTKSKMQAMITNA